jgi:hypothetical protein
MLSSYPRVDWKCCDNLDCDRGDNVDGDDIGITVVVSDMLMLMMMMMMIWW